jgi:hypothetical protein
VLPGHWTTPEGREKAVEYATMRRADLTHGDKPDLAMANAVYLVDRYSLDLLPMQTAAKERIRWLSVQLAIANQKLAASPALYEALEALVEEVCDYARINNLGEPEAKHNVKLARAALLLARGGGE